MLNASYQRGAIVIDSSDFRTKWMSRNHGTGYMPELGLGTLIPDATATRGATRNGGWFSTFRLCGTISK